MQETVTARTREEVRILMMKLIVFSEQFQADGKRFMSIIIIRFTIDLSGVSSDYPHFSDKNIEAKKIKYLSDY